jgi:hypothetical protein
MSLHLPTGYDIFGELLEYKLDFVDKSLFIKEVLDDSTKVCVITRPRRFGKTLNLTMLHYFLSSEYYGTKTAGMFDGLKIANVDEGKYLKEHQGKYPVIFVSLKQVNNNTFEDAYGNLLNTLSLLYNTHCYLIKSKNLQDYEKNKFQKILEKKADRGDVEYALQNLSQLLFQHHGVKPWLLIDEYDTPLQAAYLNHYYDDMVGLLRNMFGVAFKTNPYLNRAIVTGILRISKESLFSQANNVIVYSLLNDKYSEHFGFTESEVDDLLIRSELEVHAQDIKAWYNGYQIGNTILYNPWSITNCLKSGGILKPYWVNTSGNDLIHHTIAHSGDRFRDELESFMEGKTLEMQVNEHVVFGDLAIDGKAGWNLLLMAGYLKPVSERMDFAHKILYQLAIPNLEVRSLYDEILTKWLAVEQDDKWYNEFLEHLLTANFERFTYDLRELLEYTVSYRDTAQNPEAFYHGLMIGLTATLHYRQDYQISSNRESGYGLYDYLILSKNPERPSLVIEIKRVRREKLSDEALTQKLQETAQLGLEQIQVKKYITQAKQESPSPVVQLSLAFCGKEFEWCSITDYAA